MGRNRLRPALEDAIDLDQCSRHQHIESVRVDEWEAIFAEDHDTKPGSPLTQ
ncbi:MAG: hypothetical protein ACRBN8_36885 [Nannocystales bacterium]